MSHIATIKVEIKDLSALEAACARLGLTFKRGQERYKWYQGTSPCAHAISHADAAYEVGIVAKEDGTYELAWDNFIAGGLTALIGDHAENLVQAYAIEAAKNAAMLQGHSVYEEALADGSVRLHVQVNS